MNLSKIKKYNDLLPQSLTVSITKDVEGYYAKIHELKYCQTQGDNIPDLLYMINDAIYTCLNIPEKYRKYVDSYYPESFIKLLDQKKWQNAMGNLMKEKIDSNHESKFNKVALV